VLSEEEYITFYYEKARLIDGQYSNNERRLNNAQLLTKYKKYCKAQAKIDSQKKVFNTITEEWEGKEPSNYLKNVFLAEKEARECDPQCSQWYQHLSIAEYSFLSNKSRIFQDNKGQILYDPAHIINRGGNTKLANCVENIIMLPRYIHSLLDQGNSPFSGKKWSLEEKEAFWIKIVGKARWDFLHTL
jgi:hypothetical protein